MRCRQRAQSQREIISRLPQAQSPTEAARYLLPLRRNLYASAQHCHLLHSEVPCSCSSGKALVCPTATDELDLLWCPPRRGPGRKGGSAGAGWSDQATAVSAPDRKDRFRSSPQHSCLITEKTALARSAFLARATSRRDAVPGAPFSASATLGELPLHFGPGAPWAGSNRGASWWHPSPDCC